MNQHVNEQSQIKRNDDDRSHVAAYNWRDEDMLFAELTATLALPEDSWASIAADAKRLIHSIRVDGKTELIDQFLVEYGLSSHEGVQLMRLAEALSRTTDPVTQDELIRDKMMGGDWMAHAGKGHTKAMSASAYLLRIAEGWLKWSGNQKNIATGTVAKIGDSVMRATVRQAVHALSGNFVFAETLPAALKRATEYGRKGYLFSFDMLGEAARTQGDAERYYQSYARALDQVIVSATSNNPSENHGISIKLSALHPRYEFAQRQKAVKDIVQMLVPLAKKARDASVQITIDAEEAERLDISMDVLCALTSHPDLHGWKGLGFVVQAYQRRAMPLIDWLANQSEELGAPLYIRLVKGAYWDSEIKRAQEMGLESYPVYTRKEMTDLSYMACARKLLERPDCFTPQFATHNATSVAAIHELAKVIAHKGDYEFQRLFGMGQQLHDTILERGEIRSRIYAPVGTQKDLLSYLIRRLLENGANSSFVNKIGDDSISPDELTVHPSAALCEYDSVSNDNISIPRGFLSTNRLSAKGWDLSDRRDFDAFKNGLEQAQSDTYTFGPLVAGESLETVPLAVKCPADRSVVVGHIHHADSEIAAKAMDTAHRAFADWSGAPVKERAAALRKTADLLEERASIFHYLAVREAGKSWQDAIDEVREAVDFCRYYAEQAELKGFAGRDALGVTICISPWNFPLAIFLGQITAALAAGNTVVAKPADQTPLIAAAAVKLLHEAGVPKAAVNLVPGTGAEVGSALVAHKNTAAVCFTGSTATAKTIARTLVASGRPLTPFIAETGGLNAMIVDSSALLEQTVDAVISSAFQSAGQRCSALRLLCIQDDIADDFYALLSGAMDALRVGDPWDISNDIGPVIDALARDKIAQHIGELRKNTKLIGETKLPSLPESFFIAPVAFEIRNFDDLKEEIFGPVLHVVRYAAKDKMALVSKINASGYGLTLGVHSRIDSVSNGIAERADVGNIYINRNQIGAVVGVQPFGGHGLSGTGPKAGGPLYLYRLSKGANNNTHDIVSKALAEPQLLPCPVGETNRYRLMPRGTLLSFLDNATDLNKCAEYARVTGNRIIHAGRAAIAPEIFEIVTSQPNGSDLKALLSQTNIAALLCSIENDNIDIISQIWSEREGAILPILTPDDGPERYVHEKTVTRNIAAAGGDVSLLNS